MTNTIKIAFAIFWGYCFLNFLFLAYGIDKSRHRIEKLEQQVHTLDSLNQKQEQAISNLQYQITTFKNIHICEDRSHETCDGDCDCDGIACDTL